MAKESAHRNYRSGCARAAWWTGLLAVVLSGAAAAQAPADLGTKKIAEIVNKCEADKICAAMKEDRPRLSCVFQCALKRANSPDAGGAAPFMGMEIPLPIALADEPSRMAEPDLPPAYVGPRVLSDEEKLKIGNEAANRKFIRAKELDLLQSRGFID